MPEPVYTKRLLTATPAWRKNRTELEVRMQIARHLPRYWR